MLPNARETLRIGSLSQLPSDKLPGLVSLKRHILPLSVMEVPGPCGRGDCVKKEYVVRDVKAQVPLGHPMPCFPVTLSPPGRRLVAWWRGGCRYLYPQRCGGLPSACSLHIPGNAFSLPSCT